MTRRIRAAVADQFVKPALLELGFAEDQAAELAPKVIAFLRSPVAWRERRIYGPGVRDDGQLVVRVTSAGQELIELLAETEWTE